MENKSGKLKYYMDLEVQTGTNKTRMQFFLTDLGENKAIFGYLWLVLRWLAFFALVEIK
jgi:hypothetical protein